MILNRYKRSLTSNSKLFLLSSSSSSFPSSPSYLSTSTSTSSKLPLVTSLPGEVYTKSKYYEHERKNLLGKSWQLIGHQSQLPLDGTIPASYIAETICNWPTIAVRSGKTGDINAFHNVCRHRAGPLEWDNTKGSCGIHGLKCKYHGWTYSIDGELRGVPSFNTSCTQDINKKDYSLWPMRVAVWRGLVFIQQLPDNNSNIPMSGPVANQAFIDDNLALVNRLENVPLEDFQVYSTSTHVIKCNWKVYVENYLEGYHIPTIHPVLNSQVDMNDYTVHVGDNYVEHTTTTSNSNYEGVWVWFNPTLAINWYGKGLSLERIVPTGPDTTEIRYIFMLRNQASKSEKDIQEFLAAMETSRIVTEEDILICESVYSALKGGGYTSPGKLAPRHEKGVEYFQSIIKNIHNIKE